MAEQKNVKTRVQIKRDTSTNWAKATNFIPLDGEMIHYSDLNKIKIGDGVTTVNNLPFTTQRFAEINENIIKDPNKTYIVFKGQKFASYEPSPTESYGLLSSIGMSIDWGDGTTTTYSTANQEVIHTYNDYNENSPYHLISISDNRSNLGFISYGVDDIVELYLSEKIDTLSSRAIYELSSLKKVKLPSKLSTIGGDTFGLCTSLKSITIPENVIQLEYSTFFGCSNLKTIIFKSTTPPSIETNSIPSTVEKIIVPKESINVYKTATNWSNFANKIVYEVNSGDIDVTAAGDNTFTGSNIFKNNKVITSNYNGLGFEVQYPSINNKTHYSLNMIQNTDGYGNQYTIMIPSKAGTFALTDDIKIKSATLSGTTLSITI